MAVDIDQLAQEIEDGWIPGSVYSDPAIFELEKERIFGRAWVFLAHESEIPSAGDYVVRRIVEDSFIVSRDEEGEIHVLFNMCLHRGMQICRAELGNTSHFRCPYHGWTYRNTGELWGVPFHRDAYGGDEGLSKEKMALLPAPKTASYNGMIFASLDADAPPLEDYLGDFAWYLDLYTNRGGAGLEVRGPQRVRVAANWKIAMDNNIGDTYHSPVTHRSASEIGLIADTKASKRKQGAVYWAGMGGGTTYRLPDGDLDQRLSAAGYPPELIDRMKTAWSPRQLALLEDESMGYMPSAASLFPNLTLNHNWPVIDAKGTVAPFIAIRTWQPTGPDSMEICSWFAVDKAAPEWFKEASYKAYVTVVGSSGMFDQDDVENWTSITSAAKGSMARRHRLHSRMGLDAHGQLLKKPLVEWPGPGTAFVGFGEYNQRQLWNIWARALSGKDLGGSR